MMHLTKGNSNQQVFEYCMIDCGLLSFVSFSKLHFMKIV